MNGTSYLSERSPIPIVYDDPIGLFETIGEHICEFTLIPWTDIALVLVELVIDNQVGTLSFESGPN